MTDATSAPRSRTRVPIAVGVAMFVPGGCGLRTAALIDTAGPVAAAQSSLMLLATLIMMIVVVPVFVLGAVIAWRYRAGSSARYTPDWDFSRTLEIGIWFLPVTIVIILAVHLWTETHRLDPYRPLAGEGPPLRIQAIALDWKWLFIYPDHEVASVSEMLLPVGRNVTIKITSDTVMNSFFIPALAGQIYAMAGMETQLNVRADRTGRFVGRNTQFSGEGFPEDKFTAISVRPEEFDLWLAHAREVGRPLDDKAYDALARPSVGAPVAYFAPASGGFFGSIVRKYMTEAVAPRVVTSED